MTGAIEMYTVAYVRDGQRDTVTVYAYPSGGIGLTGTDPRMAPAIGGRHALVDGVDPEQAATGAQRLADVLAYLTGGDVAYSAIDRR